MIEIRVSGVRDGVGSDDEAVIFVFDAPATDADVDLIEAAIKRLGGRPTQRGGGSDVQGNGAERST